MARKLVALVFTTAALLLFTGPSAAAAGTYVEGGAGYDISWPQCGGPYPGLDAGAFGIVGVNGGRPYSFNPCFQDEFSWAGSSGLQPTIYVNLQYGESGDGPHSCEGDDHGCLAYNYGFGAARYAFDVAWDSTGGESQSVPIWWLDVETMNVWNDDTGLNSQVIQGAIDYLKDQARAPGVYSTPLQWGQIAGGFAPDGVIGWVAGGSDGGDYSRCISLWPNGYTIMFQYLIGDYDQDVPC
jgi:hypothetical protein